MWYCAEGVRYGQATYSFGPNPPALHLVVFSLNAESCYLDL